MHRYRFNLIDAIEYVNSCFKEYASKHGLTYEEITYDFVGRLVTNHTDITVCIIENKDDEFVSYDVVVKIKKTGTKIFGFEAFLGRKNFDKFLDLFRKEGRYILFCNLRDNLFPIDDDMIIKYFSRCGLDYNTLSAQNKIDIGPIHYGSAMRVTSFESEDLIYRHFFSGKIFKMKEMSEIFNNLEKSKKIFVHKMLLFNKYIMPDLFKNIICIFFYVEFGPNCRIL